MRSAMVTLACLLASPLLAQDAAPDTSEIVAGDAVRITAPALGLDKWTAHFVRAEVDSVTVRDGPGDTTLTTLPLGQIKQFEVNHGNKPPESRSAQGAAVGLLVGVVIGVARASSDNLDVCLTVDAIPDCTSAQWRGAFYGGAIGAFLGMGVGALISTDNWSEVSINPPEVSIWIQPRGDAGLRVALRF